MAASKETVLGAAKQFISYINKSPSPFHAVDEVSKRLLGAGFQELHETQAWDIKPQQKYFLTRNKSTIIAFAVGGQFKPGNGFSVVGAHTDSPCLKVKPESKKNKVGYQMVGVECYGGGIWHTWFDRDLTVAGRVLVKNQDKIDHRLVHIERPILRVPNICIHLMRDHNEKFGPNKETHVCPVLATAVQAELQGDTGIPDSNVPGFTPQCLKHQPLLVKLICDELGIKPEQMLDFELCVADTQPAAIGGILEEFIFAPRLDNLLNAYCATEALIESCKGTSLSEDPNIRLICLFDNEEVGSQSAQGAASTLQELVLRRLSAGGSSTAFEESMPKSYMLSVDQAHAVHPNYAEKHESNHQPGLHKGYVVKFNANQRYATTAITTAILREVAKGAGVPLQDFVVKNDSPCGSTIGPIMSAKLGMPTIDIGAPQLSMHSIREMCCTSSIYQGVQLFQGFFENYPRVFASMNM
ncbi:aspartyl aminopeptidase-like isoform X1 [Pecten maximus]|uniref:aspartyl aminopeptidase-like isoform X1 n=1 Tax=Pecten maximus TaxID=6579 RepID=UPI001458D9C3|nr:aspartyl aminopeptidase-like isoform X1 [Pecten maximus]XP_033726290.1 aspartyl aminopeptidase-like isoform X1 [Pecten maximus]XP_033726296.1 aspartyl aminopeptidase-like isoform X1 [Pecten maximus]XP_033726304.1 aspartyl aminopeptidase-like isoform X1 [Pecten maximus]XP_033726315.1 aspartyl aminopeptidase-like isoform X1 [Pecten maximus]XP_033726326.1 aspartyl aminopeptidase-like isoform X1 [Pecten maximus]XP_033726337.1 aspartyl aminopeptidase-like isoform X1 [Pecten maximus]XP_03372634